MELVRLRRSTTSLSPELPAYHTSLNCKLIDFWATADDNLFYLQIAEEDMRC